MASDSTVALAKLPLAFENTGPRPIVVQNLRLWLPEDNDVEPLPWRTTRKTIRPEKDDVADFPAPFIVAGRSAVTIFVEFGHPLPGFRITPGERQVIVEALLTHEKGWTVLARFPLRVPDPQIDRTDLEMYLAHDNTPMEWRFDKAKLDMRFRELLDTLQERMPLNNRER